MIDCSRTEIAGISAVFTSPEIRLCHWHMLRAMRNKVSKKIKIDNNSAEPLTKDEAKEENRRVRNSAIDDFKALMYTKSQDDFSRVWADYQITYRSFQDWIRYVSSQWIPDAANWWAGNRIVS